MNRRRRTIRGGFGIAVVLCASVAAQTTGSLEAGKPREFDAVTTVAATPTTVATSAGGAPSSTQLATTSSPSTTSGASTTSTTVPVPTTTLPLPIRPPDDPEAAEPVVPLGRLALPAIGVDSPLYEGIRLPTFDLGPGHWPGSALPGQQGNMVIGGHRTSSHRDFRDLDQLEPGDEMIITNVDGTTFTYEVDSTEITGPYSIRVIHQTSASTATLFACNPPGEVTQRIVVHLTLLA